MGHTSLVAPLLPEDEEARQAYSYLLGLYLGDGYLVRFRGLGVSESCSTPGTRA